VIQTAKELGHHDQSIVVGKVSSTFVVIGDPMLVKGNFIWSHLQNQEVVQCV